MSVLTLLAMSVGLAMDAFAVSVSNGVCVCKKDLRRAVPFALAFGLAQGIMPCIGWLAGQVFAQLIQSVDHWIALIVLSVIGIKMIVEALKKRKDKADTVPAVITPKIIFAQAFATSIDALAVGVSLAAMNVSILFSAAVIAGVTFVLCLLGACLGSSIGSLLKDKAEIFGGIILIAIGVRIFVEHTML